MKIWVDDIRPAPEGYREVKSVNEAIEVIRFYETLYRVSGENALYKIELIDLDHDAGDYFKYGGDYIKILNWLEVTNRNYPIRIHTMNVIGAENMRRIIKRNKWREV